MIPAGAAVGERVGPYQLIKAIGAGGSARIDLARLDRVFGFQRHVVIKRPLEHLRADPRAAASLRREAKLGTQLQHPNLIAVLDAGTHDGYDYLALEYVHGGSLRSLVQTDSPSRVHDIPLAVALAIVVDVARGLHAAHELADDTGSPLGLVHRDVSPGNILLGLDGAVKLADFGIAKETRIQTLSGSMHGTVTYMAPEQCRGHAFDRRADVFSLGVILFELVTGHRLFLADNDVASLHRVLAGDVPRPRKLRPSIAPALEDIMLGAVAHDQDKRIASARDLADLLETHAAELGEILGARWIGRWVIDQLGPRDQPWIGDSTKVDLAAPAPEQSLVDLIALVPDEAPDPTFGPTLPGQPDDIDTQPRRESPRRSRVPLIATVAVGLVGGVLGAVLLMRSPETTVEDAPAADSPAPARMEARPPPNHPEPVAREPTTNEPDPVPPPVRGVEPVRRRPSTARPAPPAAPPVVTTTSPPPINSGSAVAPPPRQPGSGSGSSSRKVEWDPRMLMPTDPRSGHKR